MHPLLLYARDNKVELFFSTFDFTTEFILSYTIRCDDSEYKFTKRGKNPKELLDKGYKKLLTVTETSPFSQLCPKHQMIEMVTMDKSMVTHSSMNDDDAPF